MLGIGAVALLGGSHNLQVDMLPWTGSTLTYSLLLLAFVALLSVWLAASGKVRILLPLWALLAFGVLFWGYILLPRSFWTPQQFYQAMAIVLGALLALIGGVMQFRKKPGRS